MNEYEIECTGKFVGTYTEAQVELNNRLYVECLKPELDCAAIEDLLNQGADPLGATAAFGWGLLEHVYTELACPVYGPLCVNFPKVTELFLKHGMDVAKPKVPYDGDNSFHPLYSFSHNPGENTILALKMLLDNGLDADSAGEFWGHSMFDMINTNRHDPNDPEWNEWYTWTFKMVMLIVSYDHVLDRDDSLRAFVGCDRNDYDPHKFRQWGRFHYEFDTSTCKAFPELYKSVVRIFEVETGQEIWRIGVCFKDEEY